MNDDIFGLKGKTAVVTGGGGELGGAMARALAGRGAAVAFLDVREGAAADAAHRITAAGGKAIGVAGDVLDEKSLAAAAAKVVGELGRVDILVNAAGGNAPSATTSKETVERADRSSRRGPGPSSTSTPRPSGPSSTSTSSARSSPAGRSAGGWRSAAGASSSTSRR